MKEWAVGIAGVLAAAAAAAAFFFDMYLGDITKLQEKIIRKDREERKVKREGGDEVEGTGIDAADAAQLATDKRRKAKLRTVGAVLILAFILNAAALVLMLSEPDPRRDAPPSQGSRASNVHAPNAAIHPGVPAEFNSSPSP